MLNQERRTVNDEGVTTMTKEQNTTEVLKNQKTGGI